MNTLIFFYKYALIFKGYVLISTLVSILFQIHRMCDHNIHLMCKKNPVYMVSWLKKKKKIFFYLCIKSTRVGRILLGSAGYRKQRYYFVWP